MFLTTGISGQTFYDHYSRGQKSQKKEKWDEAIQSYREAIELKKDDGERVRTYGVNFIDYFPNRELGIVYYNMKDYANARLYLERSLEYQSSERAEYYLSRIPQSSVTAQEDSTPDNAAGDVVKADNKSTETGHPGEQESGPTATESGSHPGTETEGTAATLTAAAIVKDTKKPVITITSPPLRNFRSVDPVTNDTKQVTISGKVTDESGIYEVIVNGTDASISADGDFRADVFLSVGANNISVRATDVHQNTGVREFTIMRADVDVAKDALMDPGGKYYALIIGVSDYVDPLITDLDGLPIRDAQMLANILAANYTFEKDDIIFLKNPNRTAILRAFDYLSNTVTDKDNLLIFYAGHGYYDEKTELGYWLPADAEASFTANWIYNDVLVANLKRIQSKHTLLISDACFSGSIFKTRSLAPNAPMAYQKKYELPSRKAITSGVLKTVPNKSVFLKYLSDRLQKNDEEYLSASQLFQSVEIPVANNSPNTPQYGDIQNVGDEGGDFIFIKR
jgi:hypothetical protein